MKHLKIQSKLSEDRKSMTLTILEQTHYRDEFADGAEGHANTFNHKGIMIGSDGMTATWVNSCCSSEGNSRSWLFVKGYEHHDAVIQYVPTSRWKDIKEAVEAYNEWGAPQ